MQKLLDGTCEEHLGLKVHSVLKVRNSLVEHRFQNFCHDLRRKFGGTIVRHPVLTDDFAPEERELLFSRV